ncbi:hypothetical protein ACFS5M_09070 [Lacinutrix iliipiscaria]|uniref:Uncharacterized protein n=1 Tax=Lacinutrix iliipiscaria TaxID=1230532 RepID=A0ABW5WNF7_9FLAO
MANIKLVADREFERDYQIYDGRIITLVFDEWDNSITFSENGNKIGDEFKFIDYSEREERYLLARMFSPIERAGLGREALKFFIDITGAIIYAQKNDGQVRKDGSNLTGNAPFFVGKMQEEGLIEKYNY